MNGFSEPANVIIDKEMNVSFVEIYPVNSVPDIGEIIAFPRGCPEFPVMLQGDETGFFPCCRILIKKVVRSARKISARHPG